GSGAAGAMKVERVERFVVRLPLKRAYETSGSRETHQTHILARVESEGAVGWGESVAPEQPWYSGETPKTVWYALDEVILPQLLGADLAGPADADAKLGWIREPASMLDATSAYTLADTPLFRRIDAYHPTMIEQPLAHDDIVDHATLQKAIATPICLDESIHSSEDARKAIEIGATKIVNIKPGRVGGHASAKRVHDVCADSGVPVWCGGMLEFGVGRAHNVHLASLPNFSLPGDVSASARYFATEIIGEPFTVDRDGTMKVPTKPGIGVTVLEDLIRKLALERKEIRPN